MVDIEQERKDFEFWAKEEWSNGQAIPDNAWKGWLARASKPLSYEGPEGYTLNTGVQTMDDEEYVHVIFRNSDHSDSLAKNWDWNLEGDAHDIIWYKIES